MGWPRPSVRSRRVQRKLGIRQYLCGSFIDVIYREPSKFLMNFWWKVFSRMRKPNLCAVSLHLPDVNGASHVSSATICLTRIRTQCVFQFLLNNVVSMASFTVHRTEISCRKVRPCTFLPLLGIGLGVGNTAESRTTSVCPCALNIPNLEHYLATQFFPYELVSLPQLWPMQIFHILILLSIPDVFQTNRQTETQTHQPENHNAE